MLSWIPEHAQDDDEKTCIICLDEFQPGEDIRRLRCQHYFHRACVDKWLLERQRTCPLCLQDVAEATDYHKSPPLSPRVRFFFLITPKKSFNVRKRQN